MTVGALRLVVRGTVQGVGFRWFVREAARRTDLAGWVRNCPDGSVEISVAGEDWALDRLLAAVRRGPPGAQVDTVECLPAAPESLERPFAIRR